jgi:hypothetical protein
MQDQMMANQHAMMPMGQPGITVSPVIKIVNGPDHSIGGPESGEGDIKIKRAPTHTSVPTKTIATTSPEKPAEESSGLGGVIDFAKSLFIKKVG